MLCIGHRGARGHEPENTLLSIEEAIKMGVDWIEIDVHAVEGQAIVIHDDSLDRTTNGHGKLADCTLSYIRRLDAGKKQRVPYLLEVMAMIDGRAGLNIEIKDPNVVPLVVDNIKVAVGSNICGYDQFMVSSFNHAALCKIRELDSAIKTGALVGTRTTISPEHAARLAEFYIVDYTLVTPGLVDRAEQAGLIVYAFTVNYSLDFILLDAMGVKGIITDYPDRLTEWIDRQRAETFYDMEKSR
jgi:glycerophosphoryl diester phosphodiesterase